MAGSIRTGKAAWTRAALHAAGCAALLVVAAVAGCRSALPWVVSPAPVPVGADAGAASPVVVAAPLPPPGQAPPGAPDAVAEPLPHEPRRDACTFAVFGADAEAAPPAASFAAVWEATQALAAQHTVILGSLGLTREGRLIDRGRVLPWGPGAGEPFPVAFPGGSAAPALGRLQVPCDRALLLFLSDQAVAQDGEGQVRWLQDELRRARVAQPLLLFLDQPLWERSPAAWSRLQGALESSGVEVHVVAAGSGRFSWWREGRVQFHTLGPATPSPRPGAALADGGSPGLLWISVGPQGTMLRVVEPASLLPAEVLSRRLQQERQALRQACQAGPVLAADGMTEVRCSNPTDTPLTFEATWHFEGSVGRVEPQVLGFSLEPGQAFRQRFHLQADRGLPLKFALPRLTLATVCRDGLGQPVPVRFDLLPPVRMGGDVGPLGELFIVDGILGDWPGGGNPINHASQVVLAVQPWRGPADFTGNLYVGEQGSRLCFALDVRREKGAEVGCLLLVDPRGGEGGAFAATCAPLAVSLGADGQIAIEAPQPELVSAVWRPTSEGGVLEVGMDRRLFAGGELPAIPLVDAVLTRFGPSGEALTALCFSGDARGRESSALYGRFQRLPPPSAAAGAAAEPP